MAPETQPNSQPHHLVNFIPDGLSLWQNHCVDITARAILAVASGSELGPVYVPMPTGAGKTTGALLGIKQVLERHPNTRVCFLSPYQSTVDHVWNTLSEDLGEDVVGRYHSDANVDKRVDLSKRVVVLTHQFLQFNHGRLDDRDLFVVDEAIYHTGEVKLTSTDFAHAREWARKNGVCPQEFSQLFAFTETLDQQLHNRTKNYVVANASGTKDWAEQIAYRLKLKDYDQSLEEATIRTLVGVQRFCDALLKGQAFLYRGSKSKGKHVPVFSAGCLTIPCLDKTIVLSATGGLIYDLAGPFKPSDVVTSRWIQPTFNRLTLVNMAGPDISGHYRDWGKKEEKRAQVEAYVDWVLKSIPEEQIYLTLPKAVLDGCLRPYLGLSSRRAAEYPVEIKKHGKTVFVSHHAVSIGSNAFRECEAVVYLWENHLPQDASVQRFHTLANQPIRQEDLDNACGHKLSQQYASMREGQYLENMVQQIGRGNVRNFDHDGCAGAMRAYVLVKPELFNCLERHYRTCKTNTLPYEDRLPATSRNRMEKIFDALRGMPNGIDVPASSVDEVVEFKTRQKAKDLESHKHSLTLMMLGYQYQRGQRGRGNEAVFKWIGGEQVVDDS